MPRIRTIKPELWESEKFGSLTASARLTFIGLISLADDAGRGRAERRFLHGRLHPYSPDITIENLQGFLVEIQKSGLAFFYQAKGSTYYELPGFTEHQQINRPSKWRNPPPDKGSKPELREGSLSPQCGKGREGKGKEGKGEEGRGEGRESAPRPSRPASRPAGVQEKTLSGPRKTPEVVSGSTKGAPQVSQDPPAAKRPQSKPSLPFRPKAGVVPEGSAHRLAAFLRNLILANDPKARVPKLISKAFQTWTREASLLFRDRSVQESVALLRWALDNEFWRANILSIPKFRKRYTQLLLNRRSDKAAEERKHPACPICQVMKPRPGHDLCTNCARCGRCGRAPEGDNLMRFTIEIRRDKTKRAICRSCSGKKSKESGHPGLTAVKNAMKEAIS